MRSGERGGAGKKSGYYPAENGGIDKTRVAITADRTNTMIASERNFFSTPLPAHPPLPYPPIFFSLPLEPAQPSLPPPRHPFRASLLQNSTVRGYKSRRNKRRASTKGVERGGLTDGGRWWNNVMHTWCLINQLITVLLFCLIKNNESLSVCSVGGRIYEHDQRQHHPPYVSIAFESWARLRRYASMLLSICDRFLVCFCHFSFLFFLSLSLSFFFILRSYFSPPIMYRFPLIVAAFDHEFLFLFPFFFFL